MTPEQYILGLLAFVVIVVCLVVIESHLESKRKYGQNETKK